MPKLREKELLSSLLVAIWLINVLATIFHFDETSHYFCLEHRQWEHGHDHDASLHENHDLESDEVASWNADGYVTPIAHEKCLACILNNENSLVSGSWQIQTKVAVAMDGTKLYAPFEGNNKRYTLAPKNSPPI